MQAAAAKAAMHAPMKFVNAQAIEFHIADNSLQ
jgi:hypothetical protein